MIQQYLTPRLTSASSFETPNSLLIPPNSIKEASAKDASTTTAKTYPIYFLPLHPFSIAINLNNRQTSNIQYPSVYAMSPAQPGERYQASCHCTLIRYSVTLSPGLSDPSSWVVECNCSICARNGSLNVYVQNSCIEFETDGGLKSDVVEKYSFGKQRVQHYFCGRCGSSLMAESVEKGFYEGVKALNVRMFCDIDVKTLQRRYVDGKSL